MGQGRPVGANLGAAQGSIVINTAQLAQARAAVNAFATGVNTTLTGMNPAINNAQTSFTALAKSVRGVAGAFGISLGVQTVIQLGKAVAAAGALATAYDRQGVAAANLAGSQVRLNSLMAVYDKATGGIVDQASALQNVTKLMSVGFADNAEELDKFATAIRGISIAMGATQDTVTQNLILELFTQRGARLDQLGLQYDKVKARADELAAADSSLTEQMAYQQAVLEQAIERFGGLATSAEGAATGMEKAEKAWTDLNLKIGQTAQGPLDALGRGFELFFNMLGARLDVEIAKLDFFIKQWQRLQHALGNTTFSPDYAGGSGISDRVRGNANRGGVGAVPPRFSGELGREQLEAITDWSRGVADIERQAANDRLDATKQFESQRANAIRDYGLSTAREAEDFARSRARAEQELADSIADIHADSARREIAQAEELARSIGQARADSADRLADMQEDLERTLGQRRADSADKIGEWVADRDEAIAERRLDSAKRVAELEEDFQKQRARALLDYQDDLSDAAARLDANAVYQLQRRHEREQEEADEAHEEQLSEEKSKLQEAIDQLNAAHAERLSDEKKALDKSNQQAQEAHNRAVADEKEALDKRIGQANAAFARQLADAKAADAQRILDMQEDFAERIAQEDIDRATRLGRLATDHNDQLIEMGRAHNERIEQIGRHAADERKELDDEFQTRLGELKLQTDAWIQEQTRITDEAIKQFDKWWQHVTGKTQLETGAEAQPRVKLIDTELSDLRRQSNLLTPGSAEHTALLKRIMALEDERYRLTGKRSADVAGVSAADAMAGMGASAFNYPIPAPMPLAATGTGGNVSNVHIGQVNPTMVFGDIGHYSKGEIKQLVGQALLEWEQKIVRTR